MSRLDKTIILRAYETTGGLDDNGNEIFEVKERQVHAQELSPGQKEFHVAGQNGLKASKVFKIYEHEFAGEQEVLYAGKIYSVYRTFQKGNKLEIYCEVRIGDNSY